MAIDPQKIFSIRTRLDRPVALVGMMGAGKSRLGKLMADTLNIPFADSDEEIEKAAGLSVSEIFEKFGEPYFREGERRIIRRLLDEGVKVIATGGGAIMNPQTAVELWSEAVVIWVRADMDVMLERTAKTNKRPLLKKGDPAEVLEKLAEVRYPIYRQAPIVVDSYNGPADEILIQTIDKLYTYLMNDQAQAGA